MSNLINVNRKELNMYYLIALVVGYIIGRCHTLKIIIHLKPPERR